MTQPPSLPPLREVIAEYGLQAKKSLGQNFLLDLNLTRRIAREANFDAADVVLEIGPGPGGLTRALLETGDKGVIVVERDKACVAAIGDIGDTYPGRLTIIEADALDIDERSLLPPGARAAIVANLPYNISTVLVGKWLTEAEWPPFYTSMTLMFQREVADRLCAHPNTKAYGRLSVLAQWRTKPRKLFDIPPEAFVPAPKVTSSVVHFDVLNEPVAEANLDDLRTVTRVAFNQRRKMLRSALKPLGVDAKKLLQDAGIADDLRAENVPVEGFCALARAYAKMKPDS